MKEDEPMFDFDTMHRAIGAMREREVFFIGGAMKSGTTWLQLLLDRHPDITCGGEGHFTNGLIPLMVKLTDDYNGLLEWKNRNVFNEIDGYPALGEDHCAYLWSAAIALQMEAQARARPARVIGEKTPDNVRFFSLLQAALPRARFIHIIRDGRDCAVSNWFHNLRVGTEWTLETFGSLEAFLDQHAERWAGDVAAGVEFGTVHPGRYRAIRYEDLEADLSGTLGGLFGFLDVPAGDEILETCRAGANFEELSGGRSSGVEDRASFFRQGRSGDWVHHLTPAMRQGYEDKAGPWLRKFGYLDPA